MKIFAIGDYDKYGQYAIVMAETSKDAIHKLAELFRKQSRNGFQNALGEPMCDKDVIKTRLMVDEGLKIQEIKEEIWLAENC